MIDLLLMGDELKACKEDKSEYARSLGQANEIIYTQGQEIDKQKFQKSILIGVSVTELITLAVIIIFGL